MRRHRILTENAVAQEEWVEIPLGHYQEASPYITVDLELNAALGQNFFIRLTRNITLLTPHNLSSGRRIKIMFQQDQVGGRTVSPGPGWTFGGRLSSFHVNTAVDGVTLVDAIQTESALDNPVILCYASTGFTAYSDLDADGKIGASAGKVAAGLHASQHLPGGADEIFAQSVAIPDPAGGATVDAECRSALVSLLTYLRNQGLIA